MKTVKQELRHCEKCGHATLHHKNSKKINWLLHIFLTIITAGLWVVPFVLIVLLSMNVWDSSKWTCHVCGSQS